MAILRYYGLTCSDCIILRILIILQFGGLTSETIFNSTNRWRQNRIPFWQKDRWRKTGSLEPLLTLMWYFYFFNHGLCKVRLLIIWLIYDHFWKRFKTWNALILVPRIFWSKFLNGHWRASSSLIQLARPLSTAPSTGSQGGAMR